MKRVTQAFILLAFIAPSCTKDVEVDNITIRQNNAYIEYLSNILMGTTSSGKHDAVLFTNGKEIKITCSSRSRSSFKLVNQLLNPISMV